MRLSASAVLDDAEAGSPCVPMSPTRDLVKIRIASLACVLLVTAAIYAVPWTAERGHSRSSLPAIFGPDFYGYLTLSHAVTFLGVAGHDPWYGIPIQSRFGHASFRAAFAMFGWIRSVLGSDSVTSIAWSIAWSLLIAGTVWLLLRTLFEHGSAIFLFAGTSMIVFFSLSTWKINLADWLHLLSGTFPNDLPLPFIRMFFPQITIPFLALYFLFCKKAWDDCLPRDCFALFLIQILTFVSFPFSSVFMALATVVFLLLIVKKSNSREKLVPFAIVGVVSLLADGLYLWLALPHLRSIHPVQPEAPLFHLDLGQLRADFGGTAILLMALGVFLLAAGQKNSSRLLIVSIGFANVVMLLADCIVDPRFLVSHHAGYFVQISLGLELIAVCDWAKGFLSQRLFRVAGAAASILFVSNGALASWAAVRTNAETNTNLASFAGVISGMNLSSQDLVIAPAKEVDDVATTVPLLSRAHVLYTPEAEILLGPGDENMTSERRAAYLFLSGRDSNWLTTQLSRHLLPSVTLTLGQRFFLQYHHHPDLVEKEVRENLLPELLALDHGVTPSVLGNYHRVLLLDPADQPMFEDSHVNRLLTVSEDYKIGSIRVRVSSASQKMK